MTPPRRMDSVPKQEIKPGGELCPDTVPVLRRLRQKSGAFEGISYVVRICPERDRETDKETQNERNREGAREGERKRGSKYELRFPEKKKRPRPH